MSYSVFLSGASFDPAPWAARVEQLLQEAGEWKPLPVCQETLASGILPHSHPVLEGSSRGVYVDLEDDGRILLELPSFASRMDWAFLFRIVWEALQMGAEVEEDAELLQDGLGSDRIENAFQEWLEVSRRGHLDFAAQADSISLKVTGNITLPLPTTTFQNSGEAIVELLTDAMQRFCSAERCACYQSTNYKIADWKNVPSLILKACEAVIVRPYGDGSPDYTPVETSVLLNIMQDSSENSVRDAGDWWWVRGLDMNVPEDQAIMQVILDNPVTKTMVDEPGDGDPGSMEDSDDDYDGEEDSGEEGENEGGEDGAAMIQLLMDGPLYAFLLVAGSAGPVGEKEIKVLGQTLGKLAGDSACGELFAGAVGSLGEDFDGALSRVQAAAEHDGMSTAIWTLGVILNGLPGEAGDPYRHGLIQVATAAANATGGTFSRVSPAARETLAEFKNVLARAGKDA